MVIEKTAVAGTLESSDIMITVAPKEEGINIRLNSTVEKYYGNSIISSIQEELERLGVRGAVVEAVDHGALDCTIRARLITAVKRASVSANEGGRA